MGKIIRLTESELINLVKKVIKEEKKSLKESATVNGVKIDPSGGGLATTVGSAINKYSIKVNCGKNILGAFVSAYSGSIYLSSIWGGKDGGIGGKDNTGKVFNIPYSKASGLASQMKQGASKISTEGEGTIAGITGKCYVTLTKK